MNEVDFIRESNKIEGIVREPFRGEIQEFKRFMALEEVTVGDLEQFVWVYQHGAKLRSQRGMDVKVGNHLPPRGGLVVAWKLGQIVADANNEEDPYIIHHRYESLHPFMDGNGRSGRMLWAWQVRDISLGFLHRYYYQSLAHGIAEGRCGDG